MTSNMRSCVHHVCIYDIWDHVYITNTSMTPNMRLCTHHVCIFSFLRIVQKKQRMHTSNNKCLSGVKGEWGGRRKMDRWFFRWFPICIYRDSCPVLCRNQELLAKSPHHRTCGFSVLSIWISIQATPIKMSSRISYFEKHMKQNKQMKTKTH